MQPVAIPDFDAMTPKGREKLLAKTVADCDLTLSRYKKHVKKLAEYQDDVEVMELIRKGKHRDDDLNHSYDISKKLAIKMFQYQNIIEELMKRDGRNKSGDTDKKPTGLHTS